MNCKVCKEEIGTMVYVVVPPLDNAKFCLRCWQIFQDEYFSLTNPN